MFSAEAFSDSLVERSDVLRNKKRNKICCMKERRIHINGVYRLPFSLKGNLIPATMI